MKSSNLNRVKGIFDKLKKYLKVTIPYRTSFNVGWYDIILISAYVNFQVINAFIYFQTTVLM